MVHIIRDKGPNFNLGFGINPSEVPISSDGEGRMRQGPNPSSGVIARRLNGHPMMRFFVSSAAAMVGMHVASELVRGGGTKLLSTIESGAAKAVEAGIEKSWQSTLLHDFRGIQKTMDEWQGYQRVLDGDTLHEGTRAGFWFTHGEKERAFLAAQRGDPVKGVAEWTLRDSIQQSLVKKARALPYELPALYATQRLVTDRLTGGQPDDNRPKWYNPVDVIGDFAQQSVKNVASMLAPWEMAQVSAHHGWQRLMTYGDFTSNLQPFQNKIRNTSVGLQSLLNLVGHDASNLVHSFTKRTSQSAGAFSTAIGEAITSGTPFDKKLKDSSRAIAEKRHKDLIETWFPKGTSFIRSFGSDWRETEDKNNLRDALFNHRATYLSVDPRTGMRIEKAITAAERSRLGGNESTLESLMGSIQELAGDQRNLRSRDRGLFSRVRMEGEYRKLIKDQLIRGGVSEDAAETMRNHLQLKKLPSLSKNGINDFEISQRINFGDDKILASSAGKGHGTPWHQELHRRISAVVPESEATKITNNIVDAVKNADERFTDRDAQKALRGRIRAEWTDIYSHKIVPHVAEKLGEAKLPYEMFDAEMSRTGRETLIRKTAQHMGIPTKIGDKFVSESDLRDKLGHLGFNTEDRFEMRAFLLDKGVIAKPWNHRGFNVLGLRPLSVKDALDRHYFKHDLENPIRNLMGDVRKSDPFMGDVVRRPVGRGVWETSSGKIVDLSPLAGSIRRTADSLAEHTQVPLLHFNPLKLLGWGADRAMAEAAPIQLIPGFGAQPFMTEGEATDKDAMLWFRSKRSKGRVVTYAHEAEERFHDVEGFYRPPPTDPNSLLGRHVRLGMGDKGQYMPPGEVKNLPRFRKAMSVDSDQNQSLFGFVHRVWKGELGNRLAGFEHDYKNPAQMAGWIRRMGAAGFPEELTIEQGEGAVNLERYLRRFGFSSKTAANISGAAGEEDESLRRIFTAPDKSRPLPGGGYERVELAHLRRPDDLLRVVRTSLDEDSETINNLLAGDEADRKKATSILRAQAPIKRYLEHETRPRYFEQASPQAMRSTGINRRIDELRADMYRYAMAREGILSGSGHNIVNDLLEHVDDLKKQKLIGGGEYIEARAAVLSMQFNFASMETYAHGKPRLAQLRDILANIAPSPRSAGVLKDISKYETEVIHKNGPLGLHKRGVRKWLQLTGRSEYDYPGVSYNPFGVSDKVLLPTFGTAARRGRLNAVASVLGINSWSNPQSFSGMSIPMSHGMQRLNRYFATLSAGVTETDFKGPLDFLGRGLVGKRVLPIVAGTTAVLALDRTAGGLVHKRDDQGHRVYKPLVTGGLATGLAAGQVGLAGVLPGGETFQQKREEIFGDGEVPIRKGRWWPLGNQPWKGGRVMYFRPSWYKRYMSGYQYTPQEYGSPLERELFYRDYSPLRPLDPYRFERKHYEDRPYPVTGEYFTGPWGPVTSAANLTVGRILKPQRLMHEKEVQTAMSNFQQVGMYGMMQPMDDKSMYPGVLTRMPTGGAAVLRSRTAADVLGLAPHPPGYLGQGNEQYDQPYKQPYGFLGVPYGTHPETALASYNQPRPVSLSHLAGAAVSSSATQGGFMSAAPETDNKPISSFSGPQARGRGASRRSAQSPSSVATQSSLGAINSHYSSLAASVPGRASKRNGYSPYNRTVLTSSMDFDPRLMPMAKPMSPGSLNYKSSEFGYEMQEMLGIYGFGFAETRQTLGFGGKDYTPKRPVLLSASRAYGSERSFWDMAFGGMGDLPNLSEGDYGNMEMSEIARRFIPHRRRDTYELNPIQNTMGQQYPWLPGNDYFLNFKQGDPYSQIAEGEMRLPGAGYERTHRLHPDATGQYGLIDQHSILGDIAPWSQQYKAIDKVLRKQQDQMSDEQVQAVQRTRKQVAAVNKRNTFTPYEYSGAKFQKSDATVTGFAPGEADILQTDRGLVRLAGVRGRDTDEAREYMEGLLRPGSKVSLTYDVNKPAAKDQPLDAIITSGGVNINKELLRSDHGFDSQKTDPIDYAVNTNPFVNKFRALGEKISHRDTALNTKFLPRRTAVEDWERTNVYGSNFPQWQHPVRDFVKPMGFRAMNRNPLVSAVILGTAGQLFGTTPEARAAGRLIGGGLGFAYGLKSDTKSLATGERFIPENRRKEMAIEENTDILQYVKYSRLYAQARQESMARTGVDPEQFARQAEESKYKSFQFTNISPQVSQALSYRKGMLSTMYGADVYGDVMNLSAAIPKRKRDHFLEFLNSPVNQRQRILSTAPRLERRIYEARWGMKVEKRPDLVDYFSKHELPDESWEGWSPNVDADTIKLKIAQSQGVDASQMGYFPQQIAEANLINPSYPDFTKHTSHHQTAQKLRRLMAQQGIQGSVRAIPSNNPGTRVQLNAGVYG